MKKVHKTFTIILVLITFILVGCFTTGCESVIEPEKKVIAIATTNTVQDGKVVVKDVEVEDFDFTSLFTITVDNEEIEVIDSYVNHQKISTTPGTYTITCTYEGNSLNITVEVVKTVYEVLLSVEEISITKAIYSTYNFKTFFIGTIDGVTVEITDSMVKTDLKNEIGNYTYTVTIGDKSKTLKINVVHEYVVEAFEKTINIKDTEVKTYNYKELFKVICDGESIEVTDEFIDSSLILEEAGTYVVTCTAGDKKAVVIVNVIPTVYNLTLSESEVTLSPSEVASFNPNDYFTLLADGEKCVITEKMIETDLPVNNALGTYTYKVTAGSVSKVLTIKVVNDCSIEAIEDIYSIKDYEVTDFDFTSLFTITVNGEEIDVLESYIDKSKVISTPGEYIVTCTYENKFAVVIVKVASRDYEVTLSVETVDVKISEYDTFDFLSFFKAKIDGEDITITESMTKTDVKKEIGTYSYEVTNGTVTKKLTINVKSDYEVEIISAYKNMEIALDEIDTYDYTKLFNLYVNGEEKKVTSEMIDKSALVNVVSEETYEVVLNYSINDNKFTGKTNIKVVQTSKLVINAKNVVTYPNGDYIDRTELFEIKIGDKEIPVTLDMITGTIDYSILGVNTITLNYDGHTAEATVEIKRGVIIDYAKGETINIKKGTSMETYSFINDFNIIINGIKFNNVSDTYLLESNVDFNTPGEYEVTVKIPYNYEKLPLVGVKFEYFEKTITYIVLEREYSVTINSETVSIPKNTSKYDVYSNISLTINGKNQSFTDNKGYVDSITCYAEVISKDIDFDYVGVQEVEIALYINGVDEEPVIVSYNVLIQSDISIDSIDKVIFSESTLYTKDLFTITENGENVPVTSDMITGKVDVFTPGTYVVTIDYLGITKEAKVVVFDKLLLGTYKTRLKTIVVEEDEEEEGSYGTSTEQARSLGDLIIREDGTIVVDGKVATILKGIDNNSMLIKIGSTEYTLYYNDGIIVLDPDNSIRLSFNNDKRPLVYFSEDLWTIESKVVINYSDSHILQLNTISYSIDTFNLKSKVDDRNIWYGLKIYLVDKSSSDTVYTVEWGEVTYASDFAMEAGNVSSLEFLKSDYSFTMTTELVGKINRDTSVKKYTNMTFKGTIDGKSAELRSNQYEGFTLVIDSVQIFSLSSMDVSSMANGGCNYATDTIFLYGVGDTVYSYKFIVDTVNKTFTYVEKDAYYGYYVTDSMYVFLDGYGTGLTSFDTKSYYKHQLSYEVNGELIQVTYQNTKPSFAYGKETTYSIDKLLNVLTTRESSVDSLIGVKYENTHITNGAIVRINSYKIGKDSDTVAKPQFLAGIEIITKDGVLSDAEKAKVIETKFIRFNVAGFYQFTITIDVFGESVVSYYAVEVLDSIYEGNALVGTYGNGVIYSENGLSIDKYGQGILNCSGTIYKGFVKIFTDPTTSVLSFTMEGYTDTDNTYVILSGKYVADGIILVRCGGTISFTDYFTTGSSRVTGTTGNVLRQITVKNNIYYFLASSNNSTGDEVIVEILNNVSINSGEAIVRIYNDAKEVFVKIVGWESTSSGLVIADYYRGTYSLEGKDDLVLDGFGNFTLGDISGTYTLSDRIVMVTSLSSFNVYRLDKTACTYEVVNVSLDNSLVSGSTFSTSYTFTCGYYGYTATTSFTFSDKGVVTIKSTSSSHDDGEDSCGEDLYDPSFASKAGVNGTYTVVNNKLTIEVESKTGGKVQFVFIINDVVNVDRITCTQTTVGSDEHGYFGVNTVFRK